MKTSSYVKRIKTKTRKKRIDEEFKYENPKKISRKKSKVQQTKERGEQDYVDVKLPQIPATTAEQEKFISPISMQVPITKLKNCKALNYLTEQEKNVIITFFECNNDMK